jgi:LemA protein
MTGFLAAAALLVLAVLVGLVVSRNRFVRQRQLVVEAWRQVEVEMQRRHDLEEALERLRLAEVPPDGADLAALRGELTETEDRLAAARRFYNANVRALRSRAQSFPSNVVAGMLAVPEPEYFLAEPAALRPAAPPPAPKH